MKARKLCLLLFLMQTIYAISEIIFISASALLERNVIALIEGSHTNTSACALAEVTGIPLIRLHGDGRPFDQCEKAIQMSAGFKDYAQATLGILKKFGWTRISLVYDGECSFYFFYC